MAASIAKATPAVPAEDKTDSKVSDDTKADAVVSDNKGVAWGCVRPAQWIFLSAIFHTSKRAGAKNSNYDS